MGTPWVYFDGKDCSGCEHLNDRGYCEFTACIIPCTVRATIPEIKPQTNADRIRAMSDEELAEWIADIADCSECEHRYAGEGKPCHNGICCPDYWLDWLREEAKE